MAPRANRPLYPLTQVSTGHSGAPYCRPHGLRGKNGAKRERARFHVRRKPAAAPSAAPTAAHVACAQHAQKGARVECEGGVCLGDSSVGGAPPLDRLTSLARPRRRPRSMRRASIGLHPVSLVCLHPTCVPIFGARRALCLNHQRPDAGGGGGGGVSLRGGGSFANAAPPSPSSLSPHVRDRAARDRVKGRARMRHIGPSLVRGGVATRHLVRGRPWSVFL